jgi:SAM-dependent methyltransferase
LETRNSHGLEQFCSSLEERSGLSILDLAGANQHTVSFVTNYGHSIYSDDFVFQLDHWFAADREGDFFENQLNPRKVEHFLESVLQFPDESFDGVLVWDCLQYLTPSLLALAVERLHRVVRPGSSLLAIFNVEEKLAPVPNFSFRIQDHRTLLMAPRSPRRQSQVFNNRVLEKLFQDFQSVKFFLTRGQLREVIIRR